jgi:hypothetical protein
MKFKVLILTAIMVFAFSGLADAQQCVKAISSGTFTSSKVISGVPVALVDGGLQTDGTADVTVLLYDNATTASGTIRAWLFVPSGSKLAGWNCPVPSVFVNGIYASVTGTGITRASVSFCPGE